MASTAAVAVLAMGDQLGDERVEVDRNFGALGDAAVDADGAAAVIALGGRAVAGQAADRRHEVAVGVLGIEAGFDRPAVELHVVLPEGEGLAGGDADHLLDEIETGDEFGHRVLDLETGVHLEEIELLVLAEDEFDRAGGIVADGPRQRDGLVAHLLPQFRVEGGRGGFLDDLLVAPLDRAFALAEPDRVAVLVGEHLDLDMARRLDVALDEDAIVAEGGARLGAGEAPALGDFRLAAGDAHTLTAAAGRGLDHRRQADLAGDGDRFFLAVDDAEAAGNGRDAGGGGEASSIRSCRPWPRWPWRWGR